MERTVPLNINKISGRRGSLSATDTHSTEESSAIFPISSIRSLHFRRCGWTELTEWQWPMEQSFPTSQLWLLLNLRIMLYFRMFSILRNSLSSWWWKGESCEDENSLRPWDIVALWNWILQLNTIINLEKIFYPFSSKIINIKYVRILSYITWLAYNTNEYNTESHQLTFDFAFVRWEEEEFHSRSNMIHYSHEFVIWIIILLCSSSE